MEADFIIIGAGSAGCVLANRLSAENYQVLLLEAGPPDNSIMIHVPAGAINLRGDPVYDWNYVTEKAPETQGRAFAWPRGKVIGGTSSINGMNFVRGHASDFDGWERMGCEGWAYDDVLPHFKSIENRARGDRQFRGSNGPLSVEDYRTVLPITHHFVEAARQAGHVFSDDINGHNSSDGVAYSQMSRRVRFRASSAKAFLRPARRRPNLEVETGVHVLRLIWDGTRCTGVVCRRGGAEITMRARREVIVAAGSINSPQLLQLSGIGAPAHLKSIGVDPICESPDVGRNLADHYAAPIVCEVAGLVTINQLGTGVRLFREMIRWALFGRGALTFGATTVSVFCRSRPELPAPDLQLLFFPGNTREKNPNKLSRFPALRLSVAVTRPESRGTVLARSNDPFEPPEIHPGYLTDLRDLETSLAGVAIARHILAQPAIAKYIRAERSPGPGVASDQQIRDWIRADGRTVYHPVGTCRMGRDANAVVDARLRVRGVSGLRVVDASIMPTLTTGNTNAATMMIAEKAAAMILVDSR